MAVYVDGARNPLGRMLMSHMLADTEEELHAMAFAVGVDRRHFQQHGTSHYDICQSKRALAVRLGAIEVNRHDLVRLIRRLREVNREERS
jgi:hypothetical protein